MFAENSTAESVSNRWKPTAQQKEILEHIYRNGIQSPTVEDIERITSLLKNYGKVEGRNVLYWFQNSNAREREQRKRALESPLLFGAEEGIYAIKLNIV